MLLGPTLPADSNEILAVGMDQVQIYVYEYTGNGRGRKATLF